MWLPVSFLRICSTLFVGVVMSGCLLLSYAQAEEDKKQCETFKEPPTQILNYVANVDTVIKAIGTAMINKNCNTATPTTPAPTPTTLAPVLGTPTGSEGGLYSDVSRLGSELSRLTDRVNVSFNSSLSVNNFRSSAEFYIYTIFEAEMPTALKQHHNTLRVQSQKIEKIARRASAMCASQAQVTGLSADLGIPNGTIEEVTNSLRQNQVRITNFYREVASHSTVTETEPFILVGKSQDFVDAMTKYYDIPKVNKCREESDFWKELEEAWNKISTLEFSWKKGIAEWKRAWQMAEGAYNGTLNQAEE